VHGIDKDMKPEWVNDDIEKIMRKLLELVEIYEDDFVAVHSANNWNDCAALKDDLKVL